MDIVAFWDKIYSYRNGMNEKCFEELINFVQNLLILPNSSVATEKKISQLNLPKTIYRNKLELKTINNIMQSTELCKNQSDSHYVWEYFYILNKIVTFLYLQ